MSVGDHSEQERNLRMVELTPREVRLLLEYGYPSPEDEEKLRASYAVGGIHRLRINAYWIEMMMPDIVRSAKTIRSGSLLEELDALCSSLAYALNHGA